MLGTRPICPQRDFSKTPAAESLQLVPSQTNAKRTRSLSRVAPDRVRAMYLAKAWPKESDIPA